MLVLDCLVFIGSHRGIVSTGIWRTGGLINQTDEYNNKSIKQGVKFPMYYTLNVLHSLMCYTSQWVICPNGLYLPISYIFQCVTCHNVYMLYVLQVICTNVLYVSMCYVTQCVMWPNVLRVSICHPLPWQHDFMSDLLSDK